jgi:hypothetical protein
MLIQLSMYLCSSSKETLSTLKFAQRARRIQNNVCICLLCLVSNPQNTSHLTIIFCLNLKALVNEDSLGDVQTLQNQIYILKVLFAEF